jgi:glutathione synthase/RimK-type ligase-like ATP-grasp enzyme
MILVVSYRDEEHTTDVVARLERAGREVVLIDMADFPSLTSLELTWANDTQPSYLVNGANGAVDLRRAGVGWWRRIRPFTIDDAIVVPSNRAFVESETGQAVGGRLDALPCVWVNDRGADEAAHRKPLQWAVAREVGLRLPRTLVTNKPEAARRFIDEVGLGRTIFKAFLASLDAWRETRLVEQGDLDKLEAVRFAPVIFQEYVEGVDLRITVVGDRMFAAEIDARATSYPFDMRMVIGEAAMQGVTLPPKVRTALLKLQRRLGLTYGAIDMRRTPDGEYIFFEVNPAGQWLFVEQRTGLPISQAMADLLIEFENRSATTKRGVK